MFSLNELITGACKFPRGANITHRGINDLKTHQKSDAQNVSCGRFDKWQFYTMQPFVSAVNAIAGIYSCILRVHDKYSQVRRLIETVALLHDKAFKPVS